MRKFLTIFTLSLLAVSCIDNDYDLSDIDTDDIGIGDENSVFTCPLMTLRVAVADIVNEQGDRDGILAEADVWLPSRCRTARGGRRETAYRRRRTAGATGLCADVADGLAGGDRRRCFGPEARTDRPTRSMRSIGRIFSPDYLPVDVDEGGVYRAFRTVYHQQATHDLTGRISNCSPPVT